MYLYPSRSKYFLSLNREYENRIYEKDAEMQGIRVTRKNVYRMKYRKDSGTRCGI